MYFDCYFLFCFFFSEREKRKGPSWISFAESHVHFDENLENSFSHTFAYVNNRMKEINPFFARKFFSSSSSLRIEL